MGYIEETGIAQRYRDIRIAAIYEGTNGIQGMDLVGRKLPMRAGGAVDALLSRIEALDADLATAGDPLASIRSSLADAVSALRTSTTWLLENGGADPGHAFAGATPYLRQWGIVVGGWVLARQALAAATGEPRGDDHYLGAKLATARFYCAQLLPQASGLVAAVTGGKDELLALTPAQLESQ
jgi:hypothetical protein